jgi:hypothetical protein
VLSLAAVIAVGFLLLISLLITAGIAALGKFYASSVPEGLLQPLGFMASFVIIAALFALMFRYLPDAEVRWRDVWLGALHRPCCSNSVSLQLASISGSRDWNRALEPPPRSWSC